jgi:hypothetical protein
MMYSYTKFELNLWNPYSDNERKLKISIFFQVQEGYNSCQNSKDYDQIWTWPVHSNDIPMYTVLKYEPLYKHQNKS